MSAPHVWLRERIEEAVDGLTVWPVECTDRRDPPYVVYLRESTTREQLLEDTLESTPDSDSVPPTATFGVVTFANSYAQAWGIASEITNAIHKVSADESGLTIHSCLVTDERDGQAGYLEGKDTPTYTVEQTVEIVWS